MNFKLKKIIEKVAKDNDLSFEQVKDILDSEFLAVKDIMRQGVHDQPETFKNINLMKLGKIYAKKGVINKMKKNKEKKKNGTI